MYPNPLIERVFAKDDDLIGCQVYFDGEKWIHQHVTLCPVRYKEELKFVEYRKIKGTKVTHVRTILTNWLCNKEQKYRLVSTAIERLLLESSKTYLSVDDYYKDCINRPNINQVDSRILLSDDEKY